MEYRVPVTYRVFGHVFIEAKDKKDLIKKLKDDRFVSDMPLATDDEYIEDSYEIDFDGEFSDKNECFYLDDQVALKTIQYLVQNFINYLLTEIVKFVIMKVAIRVNWVEYQIIQVATIFRKNSTSEHRCYFL